MYQQADNKIQTFSCKQNLQEECGLNQINAIEIFLNLTENIDIIDIYNDHNSICQKQNQIKNILNGFKNHIEKTKDIQLMENYCQLYQSNGINYSNLKKIIIKRIKDKKTRWNMKLKSFLKSNHLNSVFCYYLKYESINWLKNSKVQEKNTVFDLIQQLITIQQNDLMLGQIKTYKK